MIIGNDFIFFIERSRHISYFKHLLSTLCLLLCHEVNVLHSGKVAISNQSSRIVVSHSDRVWVELVGDTKFRVVLKVGHPHMWRLLGVVSRQRFISFFTNRRKHSSPGQCSSRSSSLAVIISGRLFDAMNAVSSHQGTNWLSFLKAPISFIVDTTISPVP